MKIPKKLLKPIVDRLLPIASRRTTLPILSCFRVQTTGDAMSVEASSGEEHMKLETDCAGESSDFCVNANQFAHLVEASAENVLCTVEKNSLVFKSGGVAEIGILDSKDFPALPKDKFKAIGARAEDLLKCIKSTEWALGFIRPETIDFHSGTHLHCAAKRITGTVTNGHFFVSDFVPSMAGDMDVIIHRDFVPGVRDMLAGEDSEIAIGEHHFRVTNMDGQYYGRLLEAKFPFKNFSDLLTLDYEDIGMILPDELLPHLQLCQSFSKDGRDPVYLEFSPKGMWMGFHSTAKEGSPMVYEAVLSGKYAKHSCQIALKYLMEAVKRLNIEGAPIKISATDRIFRLQAPHQPTVGIGKMNFSDTEAKWKQKP